MSESSTVQFKLNMPLSLREQLDAASQVSGRSVTSEIIARLEKSFDDDGELENALANIDDLLKRVEQLEFQFRQLDEGINPMKYERW